SDCGAICDFHNHHHVTADGAASAAMAVRAGCELNCGVTYRHLSDALQRGLITQAEIDRAVVRLLEARLRLGMFDAPRQVPFAKVPLRRVACAAHRQAALTMARESIVLLKNDPAILPLAGTLNSIAVVGPTAHNPEALYGNYTGFARESQTILEGIISAAGAATQVNYVKGCDLAGSRPINTGELNWIIPDADLIIAVLGYTPVLEGEESGDTGDAAADGGGDRIRIGLPGRQLELLQVLHATGKPVVLVLTGGSPIEIGWAKDNIPAILMAWYPGERGAKAIADVLWGRYNPAGRLPVTFVKSLAQLPPFQDYSLAGRTYRFMTDEPLYPFGYGLSYTTFHYEQLKLSRNKIRPGQSVQAQVQVMNIGRRAGDEVVQLYVRDVQASVPVPRHHLAGFQRVHMRAGQRRIVKFDIGPEHLAAFRDNGDAFIEPGIFLISVGGGQPHAQAASTISCELTVA
ncbi:MAG: glycoside hydrolase family 3 protein, partial [Phycisphaerae bacterium]|nr:glycoside hydrolase family 3 protein [Phycisphaerae bacterium]